VWLKLPSGILADNSSILYMDFMPGSVLSSNGPTGEAPQLSSTYAEYDDGASVFQLYFNGNTNPSSFSTGGGDTVTQETGIAMPNGNTGNALRFTTGSSEGVTTVDMYTPVSLVNSPNYYVVEVEVVVVDVLVEVVLVLVDVEFELTKAVATMSGVLSAALRVRFRPVALVCRQMCTEAIKCR
jgi:hypothetical protein